MPEHLLDLVLPSRVFGKCPGVNGRAKWLRYTHGQSGSPGGDGKLTQMLADPLEDIRKVELVFYPLALSTDQW